MKTLTPDDTSSLWSRIIATFYLVIMSVQILAIDGMQSVAPSRVVCMSLSPFVLLSIWRTFRIRRDCIYMIVFYLYIMFCCSLIASQSFELDRIVYRGMFLFSFLAFFQVINSGDISIEYIRKVFCVLICAYAIVELIQQLAILAGHPPVQNPIINFSGSIGTEGGMSKPNSLAMEVSHLGRILACHYWAVLVLTELIQGRRMSFSEHYRENPWTTIAFWGTMFFCGSTTAMIGLAIIALHFINQYKVLYLIGVIVFFVFLSIDIEYESLHRMQNVLRAMLSDNVTDNLIKNESSGASRIVPLINSFINIDLFSAETWFGQGIDHIRTHKSMFTTQRIGDITDFGLVTYFASLALVYRCCIRRFWCLETLLFGILFTFGIGSIYTCWAAMMAFTTIKYFTENYEPSPEENRQDEVVQ